MHACGIAGPNNGQRPFRSNQAVVPPHMRPSRCEAEGDGDARLFVMGGYSVRRHRRARRAPGRPRHTSPRPVGCGAMRLAACSLRACITPYAAGPAPAEGQGQGAVELNARAHQVVVTRSHIPLPGAATISVPGCVFLRVTGPISLLSSIPCCFYFLQRVSSRLHLLEAIPTNTDGVTFVLAHSRTGSLPSPHSHRGGHLRSAHTHGGGHSRGGTVT